MVRPGCLLRIGIVNTEPLHPLCSCNLFAKVIFSVMLKWVILTANQNRNKIGTGVWKLSLMGTKLKFLHSLLENWEN